MTAITKNFVTRLPFFKTMFGGYVMLLANFKSFFLLAGSFALVSSILYMSLGFDISCSNQSYAQSHYCSTDILLFIGVRFIFLFIICMFIRCWQNLLAGNKISLHSLIPQSTDCKIFILTLVYIAAISVAIVAAVLLYKRTPTPNWQIEFLYFAVCSLGFFVPIFSIRFMSLYSFVALNEQRPDLRTIWQQTSGATALLLGTVALLFLFTMIIVFNLGSQTAFGQISGNILTAFGRQFLSSLLFLMSAAIFTNFCYIQKQILFERSTNAN